MDYKDTIKERLNVLPDKLRFFVLDEKWRISAEEISKKFNLNEEKYTSFENEVFMVLICFEPKSDFNENLKKELEVDTNIADLIEEDVVKNIFTQVANEIDLMWQEESQPKPPQNNVGTSFEQIILNQAKAMMPARAAVAPDNLPIEKPVEGEGQHPPKHDYSAGNDPYREPTN